jgi:hypothetical protein
MPLTRQCPPRLSGPEAGEGLLSYPKHADWRGRCIPLPASCNGPKAAVNLFAVHASQSAMQAGNSRDNERREAVFLEAHQ